MLVYEGVHAVAFEALGDRHRVGDLQTPPETVGQVDLREHGEATADRVKDALDHLARKTETIFDASAVGVAALIGGRGEELTE